MKHLRKKQCKFVQVFKTYFERQTVFQLLVDSLDVCNSQIGTGQRRKSEIVWVSHLVGSNPGAGAITSCLPGNTLAGSWNWKKSWNCKADPPEEKQVSQAVFDPLQEIPGSVWWVLKNLGDWLVSLCDTNVRKFKVAIGSKSSVGPR